MKTLIREYFHVPKDGRIKDEVMLAHVIFTTVFILLCLLAMVVTAYSHAMFHLQVESAENVIKGTSFNAAYSVEPYALALMSEEEGEETPVQPEMVEVDDHTYEINFDTPGVYFMTASAVGDAKNGFCIFEIVCEDPAYDAVYYTPPMSWYGDNLSEIQFYFDVTVPATVTAKSYLGLFSDYEEFEDSDFILLMDGDVIAVGEPIEIPEEDGFAEDGLEEDNVLSSDDGSAGDISLGGGSNDDAVSEDGSESSDDSTSDDGSTPSGESGSNDGSSAPSGESSSSGDSSAPSGESSSSGDSSAPSGGSSSSGDSSTPSGESSSSGDSSASSGGSSSSGDSSASSGGSSSSGDSSAPSGGSSSSGDSSASSGGSSSSGDSSAPSGGGDSAPAGE